MHYLSVGSECFSLSSGVGLGICGSGVCIESSIFVVLLFISKEDIRSLPTLLCLVNSAGSFNWSIYLAGKEPGKSICAN